MASGQSSIEFAVTAFLMVGLTGSLLAAYFVGQEDAQGLLSYAEARRVCQEVSAQIAAVAAGGDGMNTSLRWPRISYREAYNVTVAGAAARLSVRYGGRGTTCRTYTSDISNGTDTTFALADGQRLSNVGGGVRIG